MDTADASSEHTRMIAAVAAATAPFSPEERCTQAPQEPEVTVAMPARNAAPFIGQALASVLRQASITTEVVVVDDASVDGTAKVVQGLQDARIRVFRNLERRGIGFCHNVVLQHARAPFIAHVDADDFLLPGALRRVVDALHASPGAGQAYALGCPADVEARIEAGTWEGHGKAWLALAGDYRRNLVVHGMVTNPLRTYPRAVFDVVGRFDESRSWGVDYDMALRIADRFDVVVVPEFLYCARVHDANTQEQLRFRAWRFWWDRQRTCRVMLRRSRGRLLGRSRLATYGLLGLGLLDLLRPRRRSGAAHNVHRGGRIEPWTSP